MHHSFTDEGFLRRALELARRGVGLASPNPCVGALLVDSDGATVGEGVYTYEGKKHAEILALEAAGERARGATLFINLEPHAHQGRTPPCTDALIAAGVRRVVAGMADPNPKVSGLGFEKLRSAGIRVEAGLLEAEARRLNESFARYILWGIPLVTLKAAMTLDGKIALPTSAEVDRKAGEPGGGWITGEQARTHVHRQRHQSDAIMVGIGTVMADDPLLTDRSGEPRRRPLLRVILDSKLALPLDSRLVGSGQASGLGDVLIFCSEPEQGKIEGLEARGIRVEQVPVATNGHLGLKSILRRLAELDIISVLIEGGSTLNGTALAAGVVDKIFLYYAPRILGGFASIPFASGADWNGRGQAALAVKHIQLHRFGGDFALEGYLRDPYEG